LIIEYFYVNLSCEGSIIRLNGADIFQVFCKPLIIILPLYI